MIKTYHHEQALTPKGQKIIAALFLITGHLSETDPMRQKLRALAVGLVDCSEQELQHYCSSISSLLEASHMAGLVSEGNAQIIIAELKYFADPVYRNDTLVSSLFPVPTAASLDKGHLSDKRTDIKDMSLTPKKQPWRQPDMSQERNTEKKDKRQEKILSYIVARKSASIKDVAALFTDVSEKTIQRELNNLVSIGKINKRGNKRWSIYLAA